MAPLAAAAAAARPRRRRRGRAQAMAPISEGANSALGAVGGAVLALCLVPQLVRIWRTQSAADISIGAFRRRRPPPSPADLLPTHHRSRAAQSSSCSSTAASCSQVSLACCSLPHGAAARRSPLAARRSPPTRSAPSARSVIYLIFLDAIAGFVTIALELLLAMAIFGSKLYFDALAQRRGAAAVGGARRFELAAAQFLAGQGGAAFPTLMAPSTSHAAAHLLLDVRLGGRGAAAPAVRRRWRLGAPAPAAAAPDAMPDADSEAACADGEDDATLHGFVDLLRDALEAAGVPTQRQSFQTLPSFRGSAAAERPDVAHVPAKDGYATAMWYPHAQALAVDFVGASPRAIEGMAAAAAAFCGSLARRFPAATVEVSTVPRLPR